MHQIAYSEIESSPSKLLILSLWTKKAQKCLSAPEVSLTVTLSVICPSPGCGWIRPSPGCGWMLARIGRLSGFQPRVSGPRVPEAGKLRLRKELGTARKALNRLPRHHHHLLYKLQARQLQSKVLSRLENLDHQPLAENLLVYHYQ